ncbi:MAG: hypothetical protein DRP74_09365 [Candidatus Omnitrophota bacterium]|nr:MAG: hypothetical protein DRP74_09365 [Candidatus Omnitrophota bacterium]
MFVTASELSQLSGLDASYFTDELIQYGEAKTKSLLGFLDEETKTKSYLILADHPRKILELPVLCTVTKVEYRTSSTSEWTESTSYRVIEDLLVFDTVISGSDYEIRVTYTRGYTADNIPDLVKLLIMLVTLQLLETTKPGTVDFGVVSKKLGEFSVRYQIAEQDSICGVIQNLVNLIFHGGDTWRVSI